MKHDAHNYGRRLENVQHAIENDPHISRENKTAISGFRNFAFSDGISNGRIVRYMYDLKTMAYFLKKNFEEVNRDDVQRLIAELERSDRFSKSTVRDFKLTLRKFYKWLRDTDDFPDEVKWYKTHIRYDGINNPEDMLSEEEVKRIINGCQNTRDRAFISMLYESGCRIGELLLMKLKDVVFDQYGLQLLVNGKTGFRRVRIVASKPYLVEWMNKHPQRDDRESYLWVNRSLGRLSYNTARTSIVRAAKSAGIKKRVNPHNFRHSRATYLANHFTEAQMKEYFGWVQGSDMAAVYVHLSGRDVDSALLRIYGIEQENGKKESILKSRECSRCEHVNQVTNKFCARCGLPLDDNATAEIIREGIERKEADKVLDNLLDDQEFREMFIRKVGFLQAQKNT